MAMININFMQYQNRHSIHVIVSASFMFSSVCRPTYPMMGLSTWSSFEE